MINRIISEISPEHGICDYNLVKDTLIDCRAKSRIPENAKSIIVMLFPYYFGKDAYNGSNISKYACVTDYHIVIGKLLKETETKLKSEYPNYSFSSFCDNSPIPEVRAAVYAGLGVRGKNGLLINKKYGSYVFIGEIVTDMDISHNDNTFANCIECNNCLRNCPNQAITSEGINKSLCLSDITQRKGILTEEEEKLIINSGCLWGCDICQDSCPMNKNIISEPIESFKESFETKMRINGDLSDRAYAWRGKKIIERNITINERIKNI